MTRSGKSSDGLGTEMRWLWACAAWLIVIGALDTCTASAQCETGLADRIVDLERDGVDGVWMATIDFGCLAIRIETLSDLVTDYRAFRAEAEARHADMGQAAGAASQIIAQQSRALEIQASELDSAAAELDAWYRAPMFWLAAVAVALGGGVVIGALL